MTLELFLPPTIAVTAATATIRPRMFKAFSPIGLTPLSKTPCGVEDRESRLRGPGLCCICCTGGRGSCRSHGNDLREGISWMEACRTDDKRRPADPAGRRSPQA